ncbi:MAG: PA0069 family radical SAM protein [Pirellulales bacterium]
MYTISTTAERLPNFRHAKSLIQMLKGRGAHIQPANRFLAQRLEADFELVAEDEEYLAALGRPPTEYLPDTSESIVTENDSPDIGFRYSINPYRGCAHGCSYCYARPYHEYLGFSAGLDFETKVLVKHKAPELFRDWLARPSWQPETISFSGITDCYQPAEREYRLTRRSLEVAAECRQPVGVITKNALITRDLDVLQRLAAHRTIRVGISITTLDTGLARAMEPRTSSPEARLRTIRQLTAAGIPTQLMLAPVIPGLNDSEIPAILSAARDAGAEAAGYVLLKLPQSVREIFLNWLERSYPDRAGRIESLIRSTRDGRLHDSQFGRRQVGTGNIAELIADTFSLWRKRLGYREELEPLNREAFLPPPTTGQLRLF